MTTVSENPWEKIPVPSASTNYNLALVDPTIKWYFYWAIGSDGKYSLMLEHSGDSGLEIKLPKLKGISTEILSSGKDNLLFKLYDLENRDIFYRLCLDIVSSTKMCVTEMEAVQVAVQRAWRWHYLLSGGRDGKLGIEEQKGLIGELLVLERILFPVLSIMDSLNSWTGPLDAPKDFEVGAIAIESKARRGAATPFISINSEFQLDETGLDALYLHVAELNRTPENTESSFCLTDVARRILDFISNGEPAAISVYEGLLLSSGFDWNHDYSDVMFVEGDHHSYLVNEGFPRITPLNFSEGISRVRYMLSLSSIAEFYVRVDKLIASISDNPGDS